MPRHQNVQQTAAGGLLTICNQDPVSRLESGTLMIAKSLTIFLSLFISHAHGVSDCMDSPSLQQSFLSLFRQRQMWFYGGERAVQLCSTQAHVCERGERKGAEE